MLKRWLVIVAAVLAAVLPGLSSALDSPHDASFSDGACERCHSLYVQSPSGKLDFNLGCNTCHDANPSLSFGFPWLDSDQAKPGVSGNSHSWTGHADNDRYGASLTTSTNIQPTLVDGRMQCSTCHDPHDSVAADPSSKHTSFAIGALNNESGNGALKGNVGGTATMTLVAAGTTPKGYRLRILDAGGGSRSFIISHDFGLAAPTWLKWTGSWVPAVPATDATGPGLVITPGATVALDDPTVTVRFTAGASVGDYWDFYVSYPFLRLTNVNDGGCAACHPERVMDHARARGSDVAYRPDGVRRFSHPVGNALNANGLGNDAAQIVDANGDTQLVGDGNTTNDLVLRGGVVNCTTCHAVHNADSNSLTTDLR